MTDRGEYTPAIVPPLKANSHKLARAHTLATAIRSDLQYSRSTSGLKWECVGDRARECGGACHAACDPTRCDVQAAWRIGLDRSVNPMGRPLLAVASNRGDAPNRKCLPRVIVDNRAPEHQVLLHQQPLSAHPRSGSAATPKQMARPRCNPKN